MPVQGYVARSLSVPCTARGRLYPPGPGGGDIKWHDPIYCLGTGGAAPSLALPFASPGITQARPDICDLARWWFQNKRDTTIWGCVKNVVSRRAGVNRGVVLLGRNPCKNSWIFLRAGGLSGVLHQRCPAIWRHSLGHLLGSARLGSARLGSARLGSARLCSPWVLLGLVLTSTSPSEFADYIAILVYYYATILLYLPRPHRLKLLIIWLY